MGRKKIIGGESHAVPGFELKPFCYYCDREFDDVKTLIQHQRQKHLACSECGQKFDTVTGLRVHMLNKYKKTMKEVPAAISGRDNPDIVVHGMEGVPKSIIEEKTKKALAERAEKEKARREKEGAERPAAPPELAPSSAPPDESRGRPPSPPRPPADEAALPKQKPKVQAPATVAAARSSAPLPPSLLEAPLSSVATASRSTAVAQPPPPPLQPCPPPQVPATPQGMMAGLSAAVQKLLGGVPGPPDDDIAVAVAGLPGRTVPGRLSGLHPVALQVLAAAGVLPSGSGAGAKRPAPANELLSQALGGDLGAVSSGGNLLPPSPLPPFGFPLPGFAQFGGAFPPGMLGTTMGTMGTHMAVGGIGFDGAKRPRFDQGLMMQPTS